MCWVVPVCDAISGCGCLIYQAFNTKRGRPPARLNADHAGCIATSDLAPRFCARLFLKIHPNPLAWGKNPPAGGDQTHTEECTCAQEPQKSLILYSLLNWFQFHPKSFRTELILSTWGFHKTAIKLVALTSASLRQRACLANSRHPYLLTWGRQHSQLG